jgi:hypothetical protein
MPCRRLAMPARRRGGAQSTAAGGCRAQTWLAGGDCARAPGCARLCAAPQQCWCGAARTRPRLRGGVGQEPQRHAVLLEPGDGFYGAWQDLHPAGSTRLLSPRLRSALQAARSDDQALTRAAGLHAPPKSRQRAASCRRGSCMCIALDRRCRSRRQGRTARPTSFAGAAGRLGAGLLPGGPAGTAQQSAAALPPGH